MTTRCLAVTGGGSIGKCGRWSQSNWLLVHTIIWSFIYILTNSVNRPLSECEKEKFHSRQFVCVRPRSFAFQLHGEVAADSHSCHGNFHIVCVLGQSDRLCDRSTTMAAVTRSRANRF